MGVRKKTLKKACFTPSCANPVVVKGRCKSCYMREYMREYNKTPQAREQRNARRATEAGRQQRREYYESHRAAHINRMLKVTLKRWGLTILDYERMLHDQNGGCAICGANPTTMKMRLAVDHDHKTGKIRGLLCASCNRGIGLLKEQPDVLRAAAQYLLKHAP